ncbi:MAG: 2-oxoacid:acceptor oxidoreductase subunit alpha [Candidatus Woesearchaeota archaeon]|jgi:2-oxoglutarate ferredoxin oxidoreductase subunit alpha|nr:2-oxoacid:acceptor oxidoreductase subunit alpha [Candidatus Woesearchaeota archaeon]
MKKLMMGNEAVAIGAMKAGMSFFAAYPITPASEIMHILAKKSEEIGFVHAEDEIAAINIVIGASLAGRKSMTSSSGPGISLKQESIGLAHMMEVPLVVVNVQRVGPSTGMPTLPSQGDILQTKYGSHGDYNPIVFYPNSVEECYKYSIEAFNAAEESRSPVILLLDGFLGHLSETVDVEGVDIKVKPREMKPLGSGTRHFTGLLSKDGIPHTKDPVYYRKWYADYKKRINDVAKKYNFYEYLENKDSDTLLISFGIASRVILPLKKEYSIFRPIRIFPMLDSELKKVCEKYKRIVVIEMNDGQYKGEVEKVLKREVEGIAVLGGEIKLKDIKEKLK